MFSVETVHLVLSLLSGGFAPLNHSVILIASLSRAPHAHLMLYLFSHHNATVSLTCFRNSMTAKALRYKTPKISYRFILGVLVFIPYTLRGAPYFLSNDY